MAKEWETEKKMCTTKQMYRQQCVVCRFVCSQEAVNYWVYRSINEFSYIMYLLTMSVCCGSAFPRLNNLHPETLTTTFRRSLQRKLPYNNFCTLRSLAPSLLKHIAHFYVLLLSYVSFAFSIKTATRHRKHRTAAPVATDRERMVKKVPFSVCTHFKVALETRFAFIYLWFFGKQWCEWGPKR